MDVTIVNAAIRVCLRVGVSKGGRATARSAYRARIHRWCQRWAVW